jgi:hypothetical protein
MMVDQLERNAYVARVRARTLNGVLRNNERGDGPLPPLPVLDIAPPVYVPLARRKHFAEAMVTGARCC